MSNRLSTTAAATFPAAGQTALRWFALPVAALVIAFATPAKAQTYMNMTIGGAFAPGVYGQIAIGDNMPPPLMNVQPVIVGRPVYGAPVMYLHVAPDEYRHWGRYCGRYNACGRPVNVVRVDERNRWWAHEEGHDNRYYRQPQYRHEDRGDHGDRGDNRRSEREGNRHDNRDEHRR